MIKISKGVRFDPDVIEAVEDLAKEEKHTPSHVVNELVASQLLHLGRLRVTPLVDDVTDQEKRQEGIE